ncbi:uncharacterized protein LOC132557023 [Ylistrum balloti]|uniref:uncharacterized protein LOC132557023 n=1 Tax=Ylistrum balloti TaxID=509963 RepID=UPI002905EA16|nr:uncharacterized protein LOC132557023 [Ylistrum balloti]
MSDSISHPFVGREEFLLLFEEAWDDHKFMGIFGLKSVGKSRTALELTRRFQERTMNTSKVIVRQLPKVRPMFHLYRRVLSELKMYDSLRGNMNQAASLIAEFIRDLDHEMVMIIDNCEKVIESDEYAAFINFILTLTQKSVHLHIIVTSYVDIPEAERHLGFFRDLSPFNKDESFIFLYHIVPEESAANLRKMAALCEGLPLALQMIGTQLGDYTADEMIMLLTASRIEYLSNEFYPADEKPGYVFTKLINQLSALFQQRLAALEYIPASFQLEQARGMIYNITTAEDSSLPLNLRRQDLNNTLDYLQGHHILSFDQSAGRYNIYGILKDCIRLSNIICDKKKVRDRYCRVFGNVLKNISSKLDTTEYTQALEQLSHDFPNLQKLLSDVEYSTGDTYHVFVDLVTSSTQLLHNYMGEESVSFYRKCLEITPQFGKPEDEAILRGGFGKMLTVERAKFIEAESNYRTSLALLGDSDLSPTHVTIYSNLGENLNHQSRKAEALEALQVSLHIADQLGMYDEDPILDTLINLGRVYGLAELREEGESCLHKALSRSIRRFGTKFNRISSKCYNSLGSLKQTNQDYDTALEYFSEALDIRTRLKEGVQAIVASLNNVALQKSAHGDNKIAMEMLYQAELTLARTPGVHGIGRLATLENLGRMNHRIRNYNTAIPYFLEVLKIRDVETPRNVNVMEMLELLAGSYVMQGRYRESVDVWEKAIGITQVVQSAIPGYQLPLYCYLSYMEVLVKIQEIDRIKEISKEAKREYERLISLHEGNNRTDLVNRFSSRFRATRKSVMSSTGFDIG